MRVIVRCMALEHLFKIFYPLVHFIRSHPCSHILHAHVFDLIRPSLILRLFIIELLLRAVDGMVSQIFSIGELLIADAALLFVFFKMHLDKVFTESIFALKLILTSATVKGFCLLLFYFVIIVFLRMKILLLLFNRVRRHIPGILFF